MLAYLNGELLDEDSAHVTIFDHGLTVGDGVFETIDVRGGVVIAPTRHLARLARSAPALGLDPPDIDELATAIEKVVSANEPAERAALRVTYTSGPGTVGSVRGPGPMTRIVAQRLLDPPLEAAAVAVVRWPRNERGALAGVKSTSYAENALAMADAKAQGASEAIFGNTVGHLCEGTGSNVFVAVGGRLATPPLSSGCLAGVTRNLILERCGLDIDEIDLPVEALAQAEEAFLTSTTRDVQPISAVNGRSLASCPGPLTLAAMRAFAGLIAADPDPR
jgi:branched-chain amino acid aminotransferase